MNEIKWYIHNWYLKWHNYMYIYIRIYIHTCIKYAYKAFHCTKTILKSFLNHQSTLLTLFLVITLPHSFLALFLSLILQNRLNKFSKFRVKKENMNKTVFYVGSCRITANYVESVCRRWLCKTAYLTALKFY